MFSIKYDGDSTHLLDVVFTALVDGYDWYVEVTHWVETDPDTHDGSEAHLNGIVASVDIHEVGRSTVTIQPTDDTGIRKVGEPVTIIIDNVTVLHIP